MSHRTVKKVTDDIERFRFNTAVAALMGLSNRLLDRLRAEGGVARSVFEEVYGHLLRMLSPMAPHLTHELWEMTGRGSLLALEPWPEWDPALVAESTVTMIVQVNGKVRDRLEVPADISPSEAEELAMASSKVKGHLGDRLVDKVVSRPPEVVNLVTK